ncbi:Diguanylate phosphodiesterase [Paraburkholderia tropica]|nr:Diguanylate phosphodiesterase [Paraburkholderia tropica]
MKPRFLARRSTAARLPEAATEAHPHAGHLGAARRGLERNEFSFAFQPKFRLREIGLVGFECLIRWRHNGDVLLPAHFLSIVDDSSLSPSFTELIFERAGQMLQRWKAAGHAQLNLAINMSAKEMTHGDMAQRISHVCRAYDIAPERLEIELTNAGQADLLDQLDKAIRAVQATGARVAIDDLGGAFNSLMLLQQLPADIAKFDRSFLADVPANGVATKKIETLVQFASGNGKEIVLSGIETQAQLAWAKTLQGVDVQGFLLGKPADEVQTDDLIQQYRK